MEENKFLKRHLLKKTLKRYLALALALWFIVVFISFFLTETLLRMGLNTVDASNTQQSTEQEIPPIAVEYYVVTNKSLIQIDIPEGVAINSHTFEEMTELKRINLSSSISEIKPEWFDPLNTPRLAEINISSNNPYYCSVEGIVYSKDMTKLIYFPLSKERHGLSAREETYTIPSSVKTIGEKAFAGNLFLSEIVLNRGLKTIESNAFAGCRELKSLNLPDSVTLLGSDAFYNCAKLETFNILPTSQLVQISRGAFQGCKALSEITMPVGVKTIEKWLFNGCINLENVTLPSSLEKIDDFAFQSCEALSSLNISENIKYIGRSAFRNTRLQINFAISENKSNDWHKDWKAGFTGSIVWGAR